MLAQLKQAGKKWIFDFFHSPKKSYRLIVTAILVVATIFILGFNVYKQREILINYHWQFRLLPLALAFVLFSLTLFIGSIVWSAILNSVSKNISYKKHLYFYAVSNLAKRLPGTIWYVASRAQQYTAEGIDMKLTALASGIEMAVITLAGVLTILLFSTDIILRYHLSPYIFIGIFLLGVFLLQPKFIKWFIRLLTKNEINLNYKFIILGIGAYIVSWILGGLLLYEIANIIYPIPPNQVGTMIGIWAVVGNLSTLLIFSPTNFGVTELGISFLMSSIIPFSIAIVIAVVARILIILFELFWAGLLLGIYHFSKNH